MGISELETAVRLELPLVCIIYNDAGYGAEVHHFGADGTAAVPPSTSVPLHSRTPTSPRSPGASARTQ